MTSNSTHSAVKYPSGATSSQSLYPFPTGKPEIFFVLPVDVHSSIVSPLGLTTYNLAPASSLEPVISVLDISTSVGRSVIVTVIL